MKTKKILTTTLASVLALSTVCSLTACGGNQDDPDLNDPSVLNIVMPDLGYGTDWMMAVAQGFTAKTGTKVNVDVTPNEANYTTSMYAGTAKYDIYVARVNPYSLVTNNQSNVSGYDCILAELDDVYSATLDGENITVKDKMKDVYEASNRVYPQVNSDTYHYYSMNWCDSSFSLVRNMDVWQDAWKVPNTTKELLTLSETIKNYDGNSDGKADGYVPYIWSSQASYWWSAANIWVTQYQGLEDMYGMQTGKGFWRGYNEEGEANKPDMWQRIGMKYAFQVLDELVKPANEYQHEYSTTVDFTSAQGYFMTPANNIAMMANGDWLYKEMSKNYPTAKLDMMKMPVISEIIKHEKCSSIKDDAELSALIKAIDAVVDNGGDKSGVALSGEGYAVEQDALDKVFEARTMYTCGANANHVMVTPSYSDTLTQAKAFYKYLASEEGLELFTRSSGGFTLGFEISDKVRTASNEVANDFVKSSEKMKQGSEVAPWPVYLSRLFSVGGMPLYGVIELSYQVPELIFSQDGAEYKTGTELYDWNWAHAESKWSQWLSAAGLD